MPKVESCQDASLVDVALERVLNDIGISANDIKGLDRAERERYLGDVLIANGGGTI